MQIKFPLSIFINLLDKDIIRHLRIPFSFFLFPIYCFSLSLATDINWFNAFIIFICLHFFIYPGSNSYNSYMDKDEGSIGGLKNPPPSTRKLYFTSIIMDSTGLAFALFIGIEFLLSVFCYVLVSKAYSWQVTRLKKHGVLSWIIVLLFQGAYTYFLINYFVSNTENYGWVNTYNFTGMTIASLFVGAYYPLSQIYQHEEDARRGDKTISFLLGVKGTFILSLLLFCLVNILLFFFFLNYYNFFYYFLFIIFLFPVAIYFINWMSDCFHNHAHANFERTMNLNKISAVCISFYFLVVLLSANQ